MALPHAITAASVKMRFPIFQPADDALIEFAIEEADLQCDQTTLGQWYLTAFLHLTAHILMRGLQSIESGTGQVLRNVSVGGEISYAYATPPQPSLEDKSDLAMTPYGMRFLEIVSLTVPAVAVI
jgi:hypothetical protein